MKWTFVIQRKMRAVCLLGSIIVVIIAGILLSQHNVAGIDHSSASIYNDRLVPATAISHMTENLYGKRLALEDHLYSSASGVVAGQLESNNRSIDSLLYLFEKTYLVAEEIKCLAAFKSEHAMYKMLETKILAFCEEGNESEARKIFSRTGAFSFRKAISSLHELTDIQSNVGKDLLRESRSNMASFGMITSLQIALSIVIGLMILALIYDSRIVNTPATRGNNRYFNLN